MPTWHLLFRALPLRHLHAPTMARACRMHARACPMQATFLPPHARFPSGGALTRVKAAFDARHQHTHTHTH